MRNFHLLISLFAFVVSWQTRWSYLCGTSANMLDEKNSGGDGGDLVATQGMLGIIAQLFHFVAEEKSEMKRILGLGSLWQPSNYFQFRTC